MKTSQSRRSQSHASSERSLLAAASGEGHAHAVDRATETTREARIREAAYALYETRGCTHGHDVEDWLAAEAVVGRS